MILTDIGELFEVGMSHRSVVGCGSPGFAAIVHGPIESLEEHVLENAAVIAVGFRMVGALGQIPLLIREAIQFEKLWRDQTHLFEKPHEKGSANEPNGKLLRGS